MKTFVLAALAAALTLGWPAPLAAHDSWISRGGLRNGAGEWCCGEGDCFVIDSAWVSPRADGYHIVVKQVDPIDPAREQTKFEIVPYAEAQLSRDGQYWRCRRPNGTRRCFFAPPPNT